MYDFFSKVPDNALFLLLSFVSISIAVIAIFAVKRFIPHELRTRDNATVGYISELISMIYSVLVGLTALYLFNNNSYTANAVQMEANAVADVYRDSKWLKEPTRSQIQADIKTYLDKVINVEWPSMKMGQDVNKDGDAIIEGMAGKLEIYHVSTDTELLVLREMLSGIKSLYDSREQRIHMSYSQLSHELWIVIIIGTILTVGINCLFAMNLYMHIVTVAAAALMTSSMLFLLLTLDRPFQGEFVIEPASLQSLLEYIDKNPGPTKPPPSLPAKT